MISQFKKLFDRSIVPNNRITITEHDKFREVKKHNREVLNTFDEWLSEYDWKNSYYGYGVPSYIYPLLNSYIGLETTYTDLIAYYSRAFKKVKYLELGVSVGKNFMQLANNFECALLTGFDIENINPVIHNSLKHQSTINWPTASDSLRKAPSYLSKYKLNTNSISYLAGDIWDENSWKNFEGTKFNVIFSDALHDPQALLWEFEMIKKYNLLEDEFLFFGTI